jgi:TATA-binding protein-associated factor
LPYVIFLVVPVLGRMSDSDDDVRLVSTNTFATLVKLVPLEVRFQLFVLYAALTL